MTAELELQAKRKLEDFERTLERMAEDAKRDLVQRLITNHGQNVWLTLYQAAGILNWSPATVKEHLPCYDSTEKGGAYRYLLSDIEAKMAERKIEK